MKGVDLLEQQLRMALKLAGQNGVTYAETLGTLELIKLEVAREVQDLEKKKKEMAKAIQNN